MPFSHVCSSTPPEQKHMHFSVQIPFGWGMANSKFELNRPNHSQDVRLQNLSNFLCIFLLFATLFEITITRTCFNGLP